MKSRMKADRTSRSQMFFKIGAFKNFPKSTGKHQCRSKEHLPATALNGECRKSVL